MPHDDREQVAAESSTDWRAWLEDNQRSSTGVWLVSWKKATGKPAMTYGESVEEALAFGWVDSKGSKLDDERTMLWFAPRKNGQRLVTAQQGAGGASGATAGWPRRERP